MYAFYTQIVIHPGHTRPLTARSTTNGPSSSALAQITIHLSHFNPPEVPSTIHDSLCSNSRNKIQTKMPTALQSTAVGWLLISLGHTVHTPRPQIPKRKRKKQKLTIDMKKSSQQRTGNPSPKPALSLILPTPVPEQAGSRGVGSF